MAHQPTLPVKIDLVRTSLLVVLLREVTELMFLQNLLNTSLPKNAGLHLVIMSVGLEPTKLTSKAGLLTPLVNSKKLAKFTLCPIQLPSIELLA